MKKLNLNNLSVKSFVTSLDNHNLKTVRGGATIDYTVDFETDTSNNCAGVLPTQVFCDPK